jgi:hypothetical protein
MTVENMLVLVTIVPQETYNQENTCRKLFLIRTIRCHTCAVTTEISSLVSFILQEIALGLHQNTSFALPLASFPANHSQS